jgi:DNA (cytosine-5)-methyltransferase 1
MASVIWIRQERKKRKLSQAKLARLLHLRQYILSQWELGKVIPNEDDVKKIRGAFEGFDKDLESGAAFEFLRRKSPTNVKFDFASEIKKSKPNGSRGAANTNPAYREMLTRLNESPLPRDAFKAISLFSGCGGLSLGFKWAGFKIEGNVELVESARAIYEANFPDTKSLGADIRGVTEQDITRWKREFGHIHVLFGGPPCQGFSLAGKRDKYDPRNQLYAEFARVAGELRPDVVLLENVRLLTSMRAPDHSLITDHIIRDFDDAGYRCKFQPLNARDYGVPQFRERVFFIGLRKDLSNIPIVFPEKTHGVTNMLPLFGSVLKPYVTFRDATGDLERLESGQSSRGDKWHFAVSHPDHVIEMLRDVPEGESAHNNPDPNLRPTSGYNTTYKRLKWDEPCSTISTNFGMISGSRNVHPLNTRSLTIREALRCQSFPDDFALCGTLGDIRTAIGNAVPPLLAKAIGDHLRKTYLEPYYSSGSL